MPTDVISGLWSHSRLAGAANGVILSTTSAFVGLIQGTQYVDLITRNFATAVNMRYIACPYVVVLKTHDKLASKPFDYSEVAQDGSTNTSVVLTALPTLAAGGALWIGCPVRYRGAHIDVDGANAEANNLTVHYPNVSLVLTDISDTDNTDTGASLAVGGTVTWTVPAAAAWPAASLREICAANGIPITSTRFAHDDEKLYWTRWTWNATMTSATAVTLDHFLALNESTAYAEVPAGQGLGGRIHHGLGVAGFSGFELLVDAGSGNCLVNCSSLNGVFSEGVVK